MECPNKLSVQKEMVCYYYYVIDKLEMIQHRAARFVLNKPWNRHQRDSITDMLKELNWPSLQDRRRHARLILMYKITNHLLFVPYRCLPTPSHLTSTPSSPSSKVFPSTINSWHLPLLFFTKNYPPMEQSAYS